MCPVSWVAHVLILIGALNWGLVGIGMLADKNLNLVNMIFGGSKTVEAVVYIVVGVAAVWGIIKMCTCCCGDKK